MARLSQASWLAPLLFRLTVGVAVVLFLLVLLTPLLDRDGTPGAAPPRIVWIFARDGTVRKTALGCAVGLTVTAFVFFRGRPTARSAPRPQLKLPPPVNVVGA